MDSWIASFVQILDNSQYNIVYSLHKWWICLQYAVVYANIIKSAFSQRLESILGFSHKQDKVYIYRNKVFI